MARQRRGQAAAALGGGRATVILTTVALAAVAAIALGVIAAFTEWQVAVLVATAGAAGGVATRIPSYLGLRERFDALAHVTNEAVVVFGADERCRYVSPSIERVLGLVPAAFLAMPLAERVHPDDVDEVRARAREAIAVSGGSFSCTCRVAHEDGSWRWVEVSGINRLDDPSVGGVVCTMRDVSDRVDAERAVRSSNDRFHAMVANSTDVLVLLDRHGMATFASSTIAANLGLTPDAVVGLDLLQMAHPDDADEIDALFERVRAVPGSTGELELRARAGDGAYVWLEVRLQNLLEDPAVGGIVLHARDVSERRAAEQALRASEALFRSLATTAPIGIFRLDLDGTVTYANDEFFELTGIERDELIADRTIEIIHPADREALLAGWIPALADGLEFRTNFRVLLPDGAMHRVVAHTSPLHDDDGALIGAVGTVMDVTDLVDARQNASRFQSIIDSTSDFVVITDRRGVPQYLNNAARRTFGIATDEDVATLQPERYFTGPSWRKIVDEAFPTAVRDGVWSGELELIRPEDELVTPVSHVMLATRDEHGEVDYLASICRDMSGQKSLEAQLQHQADHDELTGLPNRKPLISYLEVSLANAHRFGGSVGVLFIDIDRFKVVNDSLGHRAGDGMLRTVASRLQAALRSHDRAGRFGGDEFVAICPGVHGVDELGAIAEELRTALRGPVQLDEDEVFVTVSIGAALGIGTEGPAELLRDADAAMYAAKARGRDWVQLFDGVMRLQVVERLQVERELRRALDEGELALHYQPVVALPSGRVRGVEVLLRWEHPERGLLLPDQFLPVAEDAGLIVDIGEMVLRGACAEAARWPRGGDGRAIPVYVNLSARELVDLELVPRIERVIGNSGLDPAAVHFEITENALLADAIATKAVLLELRRIGVRLALDDFGTGYSSLSYLKHFPVDALKIDKTFVEGLGKDSGDAAITAAIVDVAQRLGLATVAEGVERSDQAEWLTALGCDLAQGFHFARPMAAADLAAFLDADAAAAAGGPPVVVDLRDRPSSQLVVDRGADEGDEGP